MSSGATNGMASSLVFTPTQGIELHNPIAATERLKRVEEANKKYAPQLAPFSSVAHMCRVYECGSYSSGVH